ncbi:uncharacterized protein K460DRAFT_410388 [Cucurbitaria berberidis CBS 394.84]|uniref:C2H2-type domain-containing protein n=1 Tax=Cucurbitaria berberidis CBS 394.84 TaxID=1168544 RepID=A0A9P4L429_9PLEO|nr:uncharacterized protein K460DRAFT_410388 [Cucurbitaria berberidis CBS 394.84]KAF1840995.1 hypothetical protein K460DRAFT_410388 [Cucurbitaria berberidis CBS 394.84]
MTGLTQTEYIDIPRRRLPRSRVVVQSGISSQMQHAPTRVTSSKLGEDDQMSLDSRTGGTDFLTGSLRYDEALPKYNEEFQTQKGGPCTDEPDQSMGDTVLSSSENPLACYPQRPNSNTVPSDYNLDFLGITGGSDASTIQTPILGSISPQSQYIDNVWAIDREYQAWETDNQNQPLYNFSRPYSQPTVSVSDFDTGRYVGHQEYASTGWDKGPNNDTTDMDAVGTFHRDPTFDRQPILNQSSSSIMRYDPSLHPLHQMDTTGVGSCALAGVENIGQAPRICFQEPEFPFAATAEQQEPSVGYDSLAANDHNLSLDRLSASWSSYTNSTTSKLLDTMTSQTSFQPTWQEPVDRMSTFGPPLLNVLSPLPSTACSRSGFNSDTGGSDFQDSAYVPQGISRSRSAGGRLSSPGDFTPALGQPSPTLSSVSIISSNLAEVLGCEMCDATFTGEYRRGNRQRHWRLKHGQAQGQEERIYPCEADGCSKVYKRQDARLKHYRKKHRSMAPGPALSRKKYPSV